jgi:hypothetical protein
MTIDRSIKNEKDMLLRYFRNRAEESLSELALTYSAREYKEKAKAINRSLIQSKENLISIVLSAARKEKWGNVDILECILMITYTNDVVMLEARNSVWEYDYMSFSRRIGELWEPFCKLCFQYPINHIQLFIPPLFSDVKRELTSEIIDYIAKLNITDEEKEQLDRYYAKVWGLVTSGEIQLELDLHFTDGKYKYVVDFKSGFGSNEKGNTNRLLLVGSIYHNLEDNYKCLIFVRSRENNHYLNTLEHSGVWETSCGSSTYDKILKYSGYDIKSWIDTNIMWEDDFSPLMNEYVQKNNLGSYLIW